VRLSVLRLGWISAGQSPASEVFNAVIGLQQDLEGDLTVPDQVDQHLGKHLCREATEHGMAAVANGSSGQRLVFGKFGSAPRADAWRDALHGLELLRWAKIERILPLIY